MDEFIKVIVDNGVTVGIIVYFAFTNYQFMNRIDTTLATIKEILNRLEKDEDNGNGWLFWNLW